VYTTTNIFTNSNLHHNLNPNLNLILILKPNLTFSSKEKPAEIESTSVEVNR